MMLIVSLSVNATGNLLNGKTLYNFGKASAKSLKRAQYDGYVVGVADDLANSNAVCIPSGTSPRRVITIVTANLRQLSKTVDLKSFTAPSIISNILKGYYPC